jgi:plastocyanin
VTIAKAGAPNGDAQTAVVATVLPVLLRVVVMEDGTPKAGATVTWSAAALAGSVAPTSSVTDAAGVATTQWTLGQGAGAQIARATLSNATGSPVTFNATATPGPATAFTKSAGDGQTTVISTAFTDALAAKVADQFGNGIAGVTVTWAVQSGTVTLTGGTTSVTNSLGIATKAVTAGATPGDAVVRATNPVVAGNLDFALTATLAPVRVSVGSNFFHSQKNNTEDPAIDTAKVGQPVVWTVTSGTHTVRSLLSPSFTSSVALTATSYQIIFSATGTYQYDCAIHTAVEMSGQVEVIP